MRPLGAWTLLLGTVAMVIAALVAPAPVVAGLLLGGLVALRRSHTAMWGFAASTILINAVLMAWLVPGAPLWGPLSRPGFEAGIIGALRLGALVTLNTALLQRVSMAAWLDGLRLPARATGFLAALMIGTQDLGRDLHRLVEARRLDGSWPEARRHQIRAASTLLAPLFLASWRRACHRQDALRGAGIDVGPRFAATVAVATLAIAGRMAFVALPNVALTYGVVFLGGILFGARVGFWGGFWAMALTDLMITGLSPTSFVNAPAMGLLGLIGGASHRVVGSDGWGRATAAGLGILSTFMFSIVTDVATWALVPEFRTTPALLALRVLAGLAFNVVPAISNAVLFAAGIGPIHRAGQAWRNPVPATAP